MAVKQLVFEIIGRDTSGTRAIKGIQNAASEVGAVFLTAGAAIEAGLALGVKKFADFDQSMSNVKAATHESAGNMELLRAAALRAGADTAYSATEAAAGQEELAKASVSTRDILAGGLSGALNLAAAGQTSVGNASEYAATAMTQFNLKGKDVPHIADLLAAGAGKAQGSVDDMSQALAQAGLVSSRSGHSFEETVGSLAAFANAGLIGSDAGTSLKNAIIKLQKPATDAQAAMDKYGISVYDAQGKMLSYSGIAGELHDKLGGLTDQQRNAALATIFGTDAIRVAQIWYEKGADGIEKWNQEVNDQNYAAETASDRLDNLNGDLEMLSGSLETALIKNGASANDALRFLVQTGNEAVDTYSSLPAPVQATATTVAGLAGAAALASGAFLVGAPKFVQYREAVAKLGPVAQTTARGLGALTKGAAIGAAVIVGVDILNQLLSKLQATQAEMTNAATTAQSADQLIRTAFKGMAAGADGGTAAVDNFQSRLDKLAGSNENVVDRILGGSNGAFDLNVALNKIGDTLGSMVSTDLPGAQHAFQLLAEKTDGSQRELNTMLNAMPAFKDALREQATQLGLTANDATLLALAQGSISVSALTAGDGAASLGEKAQVAAGSLQDVSAGARDATGDIEELAAAIRDFGSGQLDQNEAQRAYEQAIDDATSKLEDQQQAFIDANGSLDGFTASLDIGSQAGRDNQAALDAIAQAANSAAAAIYTNTGSVDQASSALDTYRAGLYAQLATYGITGAAADEYVAKVLATPTQVQTQVTLQGAQNAQQTLDNLVRNRTALIQVAIESGAAPGAAKAAYNANGGMYAYANGGFGEGIYSGRAGALYKFAEPETRWEAFISGRPGQEARNRAIALDALRRLGGADVMSVSGATTGALTPAQYGADALASVAYAGIDDGYTPAVASNPSSVAASDGSGDVIVHITNKSGASLSDLIEIEVERAGRRRKVSLENGRRS